MSITCDWVGKFVWVSATRIRRVAVVVEYPLKSSFSLGMMVTVVEGSGFFGPFVLRGLF